MEDLKYRQEEQYRLEAKYSDIRLKDLKSSEEIYLQFLEFIIQPPNARNAKWKKTSLQSSNSPIEKRNRVRSSPHKIKILYQIFQFHKNVKAGKWDKIFPGRSLISRSCGVGVQHISEFINSKEFTYYGSADHRGGTTNIYRLNPQMVDIFNFLEKKGMMKNFRQDFPKWKVVFLKRLRMWLLPLLREGLTLESILTNKLRTKSSLKGDDLNVINEGYAQEEALMNRLRTETALKGDDPTSLKGDGIKSSGGSSHKALYETRRGDPSQSESLVSLDVKEIEIRLRESVRLKDRDIHNVMNYFTLHHLKEAVIMAEKCMKTSNKIDSPIAFFRWCLKKTMKVG